MNTYSIKYDDDVVDYIVTDDSIETLNKRINVAVKEMILRYNSKRDEWLFLHKKYSSMKERFAKISDLKSVAGIRDEEFFKIRDSMSSDLSDLKQKTERAKAGVENMSEVTYRLGSGKTFIVFMSQAKIEKPAYELIELEIVPYWNLAVAS